MPGRFCCDCSSVCLSITGPALFRAYCHCKTCQAFNGTPHADVSIFRATQVTLADDQNVSYQHYQKPALVARGKCLKCGAPAIENVPLPLLPDLRIVPTNLLPDTLVQNSSFHIFYHRRVRDVEDTLPKYNSFVSSQLAFRGALIKSLRA